jgi:methylenetetrahydrofolate dehydrogenase (NADP+)/methenyltetrahydrofolate cyclohydrolase/formyltetrahydrofolate synthetase
MVRGGGKKRGQRVGPWLRLDFSNRKIYQNSKAAYEQFSNKVQGMLVPGQLRVFPSITKYIDKCTLAGCRLIKEGGGLTGTCIHDLQILLRGSGCYSYAWLKEQRNIWHPDRFARFCQPDHAGQLKIKAEQMFVFYSLLMQSEKPQ